MWPFTKHERKRVTASIEVRVAADELKDTNERAREAAEALRQLLLEETLKNRLDRKDVG